MHIYGEIHSVATQWYPVFTVSSRLGFHSAMFFFFIGTTAQSWILERAPSLEWDNHRFHPGFLITKYTILNRAMQYYKAWLPFLVNDHYDIPLLEASLEKWESACETIQSRVWDVVGTPSLWLVDKKWWNLIHTF